MTRSRFTEKQVAYALKQAELGTMIYRDGGHFSYAGSILLAKRMQLAPLTLEHAK